MKIGHKIKWTMVAAVAVALAVTLLTADAGQQFFSTTTINTHTQTNSMLVVLNANLTPGGYATVQHGNLVSTNDLTLVGQMTLDNTNYFAVTVPWHPSSTNSGTEYWAPVWTNLPTLNGLAQFTNSASYNITNVAGAWNN